MVIPYATKTDNNVDVEKRDPKELFSLSRITMLIVLGNIMVKGFRVLLYTALLHSGGTTLTVTGRELDMVVNAILEVTMVHTYKQRRVRKQISQNETRTENTTVYSEVSSNRNQHLLF